MPVQYIIQNIIYLDNLLGLVCSAKINEERDVQRYLVDVRDMNLNCNLRNSERVIVEEEESVFLRSFI